MAIPSELPQKSYIRAYYNLQNINDGSGNGYNLTNNNSVTFTSAKIGNGANFGSSNSNKYLSVANDLGITGGAITISCWVKNLAEISANTYFFIYQIDNGTDVGYQIRYEYNSGTRRLRLSRTKQNVAFADVYFNVTMGTSDWYHLVITYDNTNIKGYVNNSLKDTVATSGNGSGTNPDGFYIGGINVANYYASSLIDEVIVWNTALTADEIAQVYNIKNYFIPQIIMF